MAVSAATRSCVSRETMAPISRLASPPAIRRIGLTPLPIMLYETPQAIEASLRGTTSSR